MEDCSVGGPLALLAELAGGVFNTSMTGYQGSYGSLLPQPGVVMTCPPIGNYGTNGEDAESSGLCGRFCCARIRRIVV
jgi:carbamoyl-phosphate synthase small subunit